MAFLLGTTTESKPARLEAEAQKLSLGNSHRKVWCHKNTWIVHSQPTQFLEASDVTIETVFHRRVWIVFDGHLHGYSKDGNSDPSPGPERVLRAIRSMGAVAGLASLSGRFVALLAFPDTEQFILVRDRLGARTGFFAKRNNLIAMSSQAHLIAQLSAFGKDPNPSYLAWTFSLRNDTPVTHSPFRGIHELRPGECREISHGRDNSHNRTFNQAFDSVPKSETEWVTRFEDVIKNAVHRCFDSSENPCVMLSGGLDSGPAAALAAEKLAIDNRRLGAVSWRLKRFPQSDESVYVAELADHIGANLIAFDADDLLPFSKLDGSLVQPDLPNLNFYRPLILKCYELARDNHYDVVLNGNAGDLLYMNWRWLLIDQIARREISQALRLLQHGFSTHGLKDLSTFAPLRMLLRRALKGREPDNDPLPQWLTTEARASLPGYDSLPEVTSHSFPKYARYFLETQIGAGTAYEATLAGRYGLDRRDPFVDEEIVRMCLSMPFSMSHRDGQSKWIMREAMKRKRYLPESFRTKPRTGILTAFLDAGFDANRNRITEFLFREHTEWQAWIDPAPVQRAVSDHQESYRDRALAAVSIGYCLWLDEIGRLSILDVT